jgi:hypothetical protein
LDRLQSEAAEDECDSEGAEATFREIVGEIFDKRRDGRADSSDQTGDQAYANREQPGVNVAELMK